MKGVRIEPDSRFRLKDHDPDGVKLAPGDKETTQAETATLVKRIGELQELLYAGHRHKVVVLLQGMDTAGKDGTIRRVLVETSPQGLRVASFKKPTQLELDHDYLWRVHAHAPAAGELVVFNRSHYEDILVVRVHSLVPKKVWSKRYAHINDFERLLTDCGTTVLKFFLHISRDEQRERLQSRLEDPTKKWKFEHGDLAERLKWDEYQAAYQEAIARTSTEWAPWHVVPSNRKWVRDWVVARTIVKSMERLKMRYPDPPDLTGVTIP